MAEKSVDIWDVILASLQMMTLRGIMWIAVMIHFPPWVATLAFVGVVVGTLLSETLFDEISLPLDLTLSVLAFIAVLNLTENWLIALGGVLVVNLLIRLRIFPF